MADNYKRKEPNDKICDHLAEESFFNKFIKLQSCINNTCYELFQTLKKSVAQFNLFIERNLMEHIL